MSVTIITPTPPKGSALLSDIWSHRELFRALLNRNIGVRYKQTAVGIAWAVIQPLAMMIVFTVFFSLFARFSSEGAPYPLYVLCGLLPWQFFARAINEGSQSVVNNVQLVQKVFFPRIILPWVVIASGLVDFAIAFLLLLVLMPFFDVLPAFKSLIALVAVVLAILTSLGVSLFLSALYVRYRDVHHVLPLLTQVWFFASPVFYSPTLIPESYRIFYGLNPMVGVIELFRWAMLPGISAPDWPMLAVSFLVSLLLIIFGFRYFVRCEPTFADRL